MERRTRPARAMPAMLFLAEVPSLTLMVIKLPQTNSSTFTHCIIASEYHNHGTLFFQVLSCEGLFYFIF